MAITKKNRELLRLLNEKNSGVDNLKKFVIDRLTQLLNEVREFSERKPPVSDQ